MLKNLIFDCGGVIFDVDYALSLNEFKKLTAKPELFEGLTVQHFKHIANDFETGKQSIEEFYKDIRKRYDLSASDEDIKNAWNAMLIGFFPESLEIIEKLKKFYTVSLFTNTNELHYIEFEPVCRKLLKTFDYCFYSHKMGYKKPHCDSYNYILQKTGFIPEETIFIDDSEENVLAAESIGIVPFHYTKDWNLHKLYTYFIELTK